MAERFRYLSCHPVTREQLSPGLKLVNPKWNWVVGGNGSLSASITVPDDPDQVTLLRAATNPKQAAIYVKTESAAYPWGGPVVKRTWNRKSGMISIEAVEWRAWPYFLILGPGTNTDTYYEYVNVDQLALARTLLSTAVTGGTTVGCPPVQFGSETSGKLRSLSFWGTEMKRVGELLDTVSNRDGGFEWTIAVETSNTDGLPQIRFQTYFPQRGSLVPSLLFKDTPGGSNCVVGDFAEDYSSTYGRYYTTGSGQPPDMGFAMDPDPELAVGRTLRFDGSASYSTVIERTTLASHARRARKFFAPGTNLMKVSHTLGRLNSGDLGAETYGIGDRGRLLTQDRWVDLDLPASRIIEKSVDMSGAGQVTATLDVTDFTLPEVDAGGTL
jgi:hypothetical protein